MRWIAVCHRVTDDEEFFFKEKEQRIGLDCIYIFYMKKFKLGN